MQSPVEMTTSALASLSIPTSNSTAPATTPSSEANFTSDVTLTSTSAATSTSTLGSTTSTSMSISNDSETLPNETDNVVPTTSVARTSAALPIDPSQMVFQMGQTTISPSKADGWMSNISKTPPNSIFNPMTLSPRSGLTVTPVASTSRSGLTVSPVASTSRSGLSVTPVSATSSGKPKSNPSVFGSYVQSAASNAPRRFNFEAKSSGVASTSTLNQQSRPSDTARYRDPVHRTPIIPNLSPDVTIRPISSRNATKFPNQANTRTIPQDRITNRSSASNDTFTLLAGYNTLTSEVASLKAQLSESQTLINEILANFSSEVAKLNSRLAAVEQGISKMPNQSNENDVTREELSSQLEDLRLTKDDEIDSD